MKSVSDVGLEDVKAVYSGPEGDLWELVMGEQIHIGGLDSSLDLARRAQIGAGMQGIDLCCCTGAGMRALIRFCGVARMRGVDATATVIERGHVRNADEGFADRIEFIHGDVTAVDIPDGAVDFVWGEDAWCYVVDKSRLINEAVRLVKPGGVVAFTDWLEGPTAMSAEEADRILHFMKFPTIQDLDGYRTLLVAAGCDVEAADYTGRFAPYCDLYIDMLTKQLTYDALKILDFDQPTMEGLAGEMQFMRELAHAGKIEQGLFVARKR